MEKKRVLIVDDEKDLLMLLNERFSAAGYSVFTAENGEDGIRLAGDKEPDIIILDILMPGLSGTDVADALKSDPRTKDIPVIFLTCLYTKEDEEARGHTVKGNYFIAKPFEADVLLAEVRRRLEEGPGA